MIGSTGRINCDKTSRNKDNNKIEKTQVKTGVRKDGNLEILDGLEANDKVVKEGLTRLANGMFVKPITK